MSQIPIDVKRVTTIVAGEPYPQTDPSGNHVSNRDGVPQWIVPVLLTSANSRPEMVRVKVAAPAPPTVKPGTTVQCVGFIATTWEMNGRHGVAYRAESFQGAG